MEESTGVHRSETSNPASAAAPIRSTKLGYKARLIKWMRGHPAMLVGMMLAVVFGLSLREITVLVMTHPDPAAPAVRRIRHSVPAQVTTETESVNACETPRGYVAAHGDCDDDNPAIHPGAVEDSGELGSVWRLDTDHDGFGNKAHFTQTSPRMLIIE